MEDDMDDKQKIDILIKAAQRIDFWINTTNTKAAVIVPVNALYLSAFFSKWDDIIKLFDGHDNFKVTVGLLLAISVICSVFSLLLVFHVTSPFLHSLFDRKEASSSDYKSDFFFGDISKQSTADGYHQRVTSWCGNGVVKDLSYQVHTLSNAAESKFRHITRSIRLILVGVLVPLLLMGLLKIAVALIFAKQGDRL